MKCSWNPIIKKIIICVWQTYKGLLNQNRCVRCCRCPRHSLMQEHSLSHRANNQLSSPNKGLSSCLVTDRSLPQGSPVRAKWRLSTPCRQQGLCLKIWMLTPTASDLHVWCNPFGYLQKRVLEACAVTKLWLRCWASLSPQTGSPEHLWGHLIHRKYPGCIWKWQDRCGVLWRESVECFPKTLLNPDTGITKLSHCRKWLLQLETLRPPVNVYSWMCMLNTW